MKKGSSKASFANQFKFSFDSFKNAPSLIKSLKSSSFLKKTESERCVIISKNLLELIGQVKAPCFLLPAIVNYIDQVNQIIAPQDYTFSFFEFWLNQHAGLSDAQNYEIRAKIVGKHIPRDDYQILFPVGMNKKYAGSHYVTAHGSPDLDTTIASFWGWVDAFGARISEGLHIWNIPPGGILTSDEVAPLTDVFPKSLFQYFSLRSSSLSPLGIDFVKQNALVKKDQFESTITSEDPERYAHAVMVVDKKGYYVGDIRSEDYESIRQIIRLVTNCLKWFENSIQNKLAELFSNTTVSYKETMQVIDQIFSQKILFCINQRQLTQKLRGRVNLYLNHILGLELGLEATFNDLGLALKKLKLEKFIELKKSLESSFKKNKVFDSKGTFYDNRANIFKSFNEISKGVDVAVEELNTFMESLDIAIKIKRQVFNYPSRYITPIATMDEILDKTNSLNYLSVVFPNQDGSLWPLGVIKAEDVRDEKLGTVSLRDFCNRSEVKIDSSLEIISVIDHHKVDLKTKNPPFAMTGDVQSCNILVAELAFLINDAYNRGFRSKKELLDEIKSNPKNELTPSLIRIKNRSLKRLLAQNQPASYYIHPEREYLEYLTFLHAIIDDTDLFSKVTKRDLFCIAELLNRMKSIAEKNEVETLSFDDLKEDGSFVTQAVRKVVTNTDMYAIYKTIFEKREQQIEKAIVETALGKSNELFSDIKEQNGCCHISQTKIFTCNVEAIKKHFEALIGVWLEKAQEVHSNHDSIDFHLHMISTIPSADDVYQEKNDRYGHKDYIWLWVPDAAQAINHLTSFLNSFKQSPVVQSNHMQYQILDNSGLDYQSILKHHFIDAVAVEKIKTKKKMPVIILSFDAGTLNSRKAQITPYLPTLVK